MDKNLASNSNSICKLASHYKKKKRKTNLVESLILSQDVCDSLSIFGHIQAYKPPFYGHQQSSSVSLTLCGLPSLGSISAQKNFLLHLYYCSYNYEFLVDNPLYLTVFTKCYL